MLRPAEYDDDSDYDEYNDDGFSFGTYDKKPFQPSGPPPGPPPKTLGEKLYDAVMENNLPLMRELLEHGSSPRFDVNTELHTTWGLLLHACKEGHLEIVQYLLEQNAHINKHFNSMTPLMAACQCERKDGSLEIVKTLIRAGSVINVSDRMGKTPLMYAAIRGHVEVVRFMVADASLEAYDNWESTALCYAVEHNQPEIVKILLDHDANYEVVNRSGHTPKQVAEIASFKNIVALFPDEEQPPDIPVRYLSFNNYKELAPTIFGVQDMPAYFPNVAAMLHGMRCEKLIPLFANAGIGLEKFLTLNEDKLIDIGIEYPFLRKRILLGLYKFHGHPWNRVLSKELALKTEKTTYDLFLTLSTQLKHLIVIKSTAEYLRENVTQTFNSTTKDKISCICMELNRMKLSLRDIRERMVYIQSLNRPPPLLIDFTQHLRVRRADRNRRVAVWTTVFGIGVLLCLKYKSKLLQPFS